MKDWPPQLWAALIAVVGTVTGLIGKRSSNRADAAVSLTDGAMRVMNELQEEVTRLRKDQNADRHRMSLLEQSLRAEREWCDTRIGQLVSALHENGIEVPPAPLRLDNPPLD